MQKTKVRDFHYGPGIAEVDTVCGRVRGVIRNGVYTFLGLTYAEAGRFEEPHPPTSWEGVKEAVVEGPACPSFGSNQLPAVQGLGCVIGPPVVYPESEACQTMKLWTPSLNPNAKKPVMFWLHGGGSAFGSSVEFNGEEMAAFGDVVVVASNHRLNCLALLDLEAYGEQYRNSCNLEFLDIIEALKWVQSNIRAFGGDPENVTLFGHSGGGGKVINLMQMAAADGLYHKVIIMAGMPPEPDIFPPKDCSAKIVARTLELLGIAPEQVEQLKTVPYAELSIKALQAMRECTTAEGYRATWSQVTSEFFPGSPFDVGLRPEVKDIPVFIGSSQGERNYDPTRWSSDPAFRGNRHDWSQEQKDRAMQLWFGDRCNEVREAYCSVYPDRDPVDAIFTDMGHRHSSMRFVDMKSAQGGAPCYMYLFYRELPVGGGQIPWHGAECDFAFHQAEYSDARFIPDGETARIQDEMCACWTTFAHTGSPNHPGVPEIPPSYQGHYATIIWDRETTVRVNHDLKLVGLLPELMLPNDNSAYGNG